MEDLTSNHAKKASGYATRVADFEAENISSTAIKSRAYPSFHISIEAEDWQAMTARDEEMVMKPAVVTAEISSLPFWDAAFFDMSA